ncbi:MAG: hypothetical protein ABI867_24245 [Kofleriaceae bacterium]
MNRVWLAVITVLACGGKPAPAPLGSRLAPALGAALRAADQARAPWRCMAADGPGAPEETLKLGARTWKLAGHTLTLPGTGALTIGVLADAGGSAATTLAALGRLRAQLAEADLVISLGGMGATQAELEATLGALAETAPWPLVAIPGDLEAVPLQIKAIAALRARGRVVIDGRLLRRIDLPGVTIAIAPGANAVERLVAGPEGCGYRATEVRAALAELSERAGVRILATAEPPRITVGGEAAGMLVLTPDKPIDIVLHGPVEAASSARTGTRDGSHVALTPGTSDATTRLPGPRRPASAGILTISGESWRWKPLVDNN